LKKAFSLYSGLANPKKSDKNKSKNNLKKDKNNTKKQAFTD
jgi:hypothetical protein